MAPETAAVALCRGLHERGATHLFGVPGTQTIGFWEGLRRARVPHPVFATNELSASFMANGYARATGRTGIVATIPGPGFTYALTGVAEARLDSVPLIHLAAPPARTADGSFGLQGIAQEALGEALAKAVVDIRSSREIESALRAAFEHAEAGEPGPVLLHVPEEVLRKPAEAAQEMAARRSPARPRTTDVEEVAERLGAASRPLIFVGQGAADAAEAVQALAETLPAPVLATTSGRGTLSEDHPFALCCDSPGSPLTVVRQLFAESDLVLAIGVKFSHNGAYGGAVEFNPKTLVHVDTAPTRGGMQVEADATTFMADLRAALGTSAGTWTVDGVANWRRRLDEAAAQVRDPTLVGRHPSETFASLRRHLPPSGIVTTDSGLHQYLARRYLQVLRPRTFLVPTDFQSMGYGIPAAIGAAVGTGEHAVAVVGDGGFSIGGLELATAVSLGLPLTVLVLVDGAYGLIRRQQLRRTGNESGVALPHVDLAAVASAVGAKHLRPSAGEVDDALGEAVGGDSVSIVELEMDDRAARTQNRRRAALADAAEAVLGSKVAGRLAARRRG